MTPMGHLILCTTVFILIGAVTSDAAGFLESFRLRCAAISPDCGVDCGDGGLGGLGGHYHSDRALPDPGCPSFTTTTSAPVT
ncbi:hypothetical protein BV898_13379 [Hypsibius exemplaris]|uniref:Uncharacterized protein n=1 Tax=Hypsibius exemplaris TaxID=2072580 RepID=A0A1W0WAX9_HYPEX|nr:hypothetical protein BV898_13379 [Hypsibius exemplaris]